MDMSDQAYKRLQREAQKPSISYWIFVISIATVGIVLGSYRIRNFGFTVEDAAFVAGGFILWILIIARIIRDRKVRP